MLIHNPQLEIFLFPLLLAEAIKENLLTKDKE